MKTLDDLENVYRLSETPKTGIFCDLLWADPIDEEPDKNMDEKEKPCDVIEFADNEMRGCSV
eukprot:CAMPEP_0116912448 /NCGR_PEP_ID=MMETSP0467-20121206/16092_1 /TAXON_ID=283647 /ORGANISM="Mesodinium pulex, Strain SPMC105" /LENGTH=61 /DNA_ID=CAMNT_0004588429 /DNA_START=493 /DNA_END=678 /DNA_ORIENTATION=+